MQRVQASLFRTASVGPYVTAPAQTEETAATRTYPNGYNIFNTNKASQSQIFYTYSGPQVFYEETFYGTGASIYGYSHNEGAPFRVDLNGIQQQNGNNYDATGSTAPVLLWEKLGLPLGYYKLTVYANGGFMESDLNIYHNGPTMPSEANTYARWSAAESANGGIISPYEWEATNGQILTQHNPDEAEGYQYDATALSGKPGLVCVSRDYSPTAFYLEPLTLGASAATIVVMQTPTTDVQVIVEFSPNVNDNPNSFANYIETGKVEGYNHHAGGSGLHLTNQDQPVNTPFLIGSRHYAEANYSTLQLRADYETRTGVAAPVPGNTYGTQTLYIGSRGNGVFYLNGVLSCFHLFHTAPSDAEFNAWITYYKNLYNLPT